MAVLDEILTWTSVGSWRPGLRHLHLGQHGSAQGRRADPREPGQPRRLARHGVRRRPERPGEPGRQRRLRRRGVGDLAASGRGRDGALRGRRHAPVAAAPPRLARRPRRSPSASSRPSLAEQVIHLPWPGGTALRTLLTGADVLHRRPSGELPFPLVNNYGPTECTVVATSGAVAPETEGQTAPSIGRPITNATALILDGALRPVPPGEPGELCLAGALVGRGYRNDPELTASRFVTVAEATAPTRGQCGCTARATRSGCWRTARSPSSVGLDKRSRSGVSGSSPPRSSPPSTVSRGVRRAPRRAPDVRRRPTPGPSSWRTS